MTLQEHLNAGYDFYVRGRLRPWTPKQFSDELKADPALMAAARSKLAECETVMKAGRLCDITKTQTRILQDGLKQSAA